MFGLFPELCMVHTEAEVLDFITELHLFIHFSFCQLKKKNLLLQIIQSCVGIDNSYLFYVYFQMMLCKKRNQCAELHVLCISRTLSLTPN